MLLRKLQSFIGRNLVACKKYVVVVKRSSLNSLLGGTDANHYVLKKHALRRNCVLKRVTRIDRGIKTTGRRGRRYKQLLNYPNEKSGYCKLKEEALDITLGRTRFERGCGSVVKRDCRKNNTLICVLK
jgi:hypothetical protein